MTWQKIEFPLPRLSIRLLSSDRLPPQQYGSIYVPRYSNQNQTLFFFEKDSNIFPPVNCPKKNIEFENIKLTPPSPLAKSSKKILQNHD